MSKKEELVAKTMELLKSGKSPEEIKKILEGLVEEVQVSGPRAIKDRVEYFKTSRDLATIKKEIKTAFASKSKMKDNAEAVTRYEAQIKAGQQRLAQLVGEAMQAPDPIQALKDMNEEPSALLQQFVQLKEDEVNKVLEAEFTKAGKKRAANRLHWKSPQSLLTEIDTRLGAKALEFYEARVKNEDQRVRTLNRLVKLFEMDPAERKKLAETEKVIEEPGAPNISEVGKEQAQDQVVNG